jgi:hypothetical protein
MLGGRLESIGMSRGLIPCPFKVMRNENENGKPLGVKAVKRQVLGKKHSLDRS